MTREVLRLASDSPSSRPQPTRPPALRFGPFRFERAPYRLEKEGSKVNLTPQQAQLLELLIKADGEVVTREEIRHALWTEDVFVDFDRSINYCITRVRTALGDRSEAPSYIETVPRRGYRFVAEVSSVTAVRESVETAVAGSPLRPPGEDGSSPSDSGAISSALGRAGGAVGRASAILGALIFLGLLWLGWRELVASPDLAPWRPSRKVFVSDPRGEGASPSVAACEVSGRIEDLTPAARTAFHRARFFASRQDVAHRLQAIPALEEVLAHHPAFEPAISCLARLHYERFDWARAEPLARRALELAPNRLDVHLILAEASFRHRFDWPQAEKRFRAALRLYPRDEALRVAFASLLSAMGRHDEATTLARRTVELHPLSLRARTELAEELYLAGYYQSAIRLTDEIVAIDRKHGEAYLIGLYSRFANSTPDEALTYGNRMLSVWGGGPARTASLEELWQLLLDHRSFDGAADPDQLSEKAALTLAAGRIDEARRIMERACAERSGWNLPYYHVDPRFRALRRFPGLESLATCLRGPFDLGEQSPASESVG